MHAHGDTLQASYFDHTLHIRAPEARITKDVDQITLEINPEVTTGRIVTCRSGTNTDRASTAPPSLFDGRSTHRQ
jgi:hypothetical protein